MSEAKQAKDERISENLMRYLQENHDMIQKTKDNLGDFVGNFFPLSEDSTRENETQQPNGWVANLEQEIMSQREDIRALRDLVDHIRKFI